MKMLNNENAYSAAERQHLIYRFIFENSNKDNVATKKQIFNFLETYDIEISINTSRDV